MSTYDFGQCARRVIATGLVVTQACVAQHTSSSLDFTPPVQRATLDTRGGAQRIATDDLRQVEGFTALDAVRRLRPEFLQPSASRPSTISTPPTVYENGHYSGGADQLRDIPLGLVTKIQRLSSVEARILFGAFCPCDGGVISVKTKP